MNNEHFKISAYLKNIIGKELITDEFVAVFELVKNSFDANSKHVQVIFENQDNPNLAKLIILDNGKGMNYQELKEKWLFVAYSAKEDGSEYNDYRNKINVKRHFAGAKGVGRFSCDRLGSFLNLITIKDNTSSEIENLIVNWEEFEKDAKEEFIDVDVKHQVLESINYNIKHGTILEVTGLRDVWDRHKILKLKRSLVKLVNPNQKNDIDNFLIEIIAKNEKKQDKELEEKNTSDYDIVNGKIQNTLFETLQIRTTNINVKITENGENIISTLSDRGDTIYKITEKNPFKNLKKINIYLFQLNRSAKSTFTRLMGINQIDFGSVFMYKNGFRIYPFGEPGDDTLLIDRRKTQGYNRFLGNRDLIGRIEIFGANSELRETSSRDGGLLKTKAYDELVTFFYEYVLKRLERYAVEVIRWGDERIDKETGEVLSSISSKDLKVSFIEDSKKQLEIEQDKSLQEIVDEKVIGFIYWLAIDPRNIIEVEYEKYFFKIVEEKQDKSTTKTIQNIEQKAEKLDDKNLLKNVKKIKKDFKQIQEAKKEAEIETLQFEQKLERVSTEKEQITRQNLFLKSVKALEYDDVRDLVHIIGMKSDIISKEITRIKRKINKGQKISTKELNEFIEDISLANSLINSVTNFATKKNFLKATQDTTQDIVGFIKDYINNIYLKLYRNLEINFLGDVNIVKHFVPFEITMIIDNLIGNSRKKDIGANKIEFHFSVDNNKLIIIYRDNGKGLSSAITNPELIFEEGFTTTNGSGLGLAHIKKTLTGMKGDISINPAYKNGIEFIIKL